MTLNAIIKEKEKEDNAHVGLMQLLNTLKAKLVQNKSCNKRLIYVEALVNGKPTKAMVVTLNFVLEHEAKRLELKELMD